MAQRNKLSFTAVLSIVYWYNKDAHSRVNQKFSLWYIKNKINVEATIFVALESPNQFLWHWKKAFLAFDPKLVWWNFGYVTALYSIERMYRPLHSRTLFARGWLSGLPSRFITNSIVRQASKLYLQRCSLCAWCSPWQFWSAKIVPKLMLFRICSPAVAMHHSMGLQYIELL